ncbi:Thymidine kinase [Candidatus Phytoplasma australiense]|uniref:Thymidine kinase n=2 Tax=Phytoplasma australiense TaxID=59748 RepID=B1VAS4_PHYAS|nr:thymidine kinase [Candidatus Phytoplasma australiense]AGL90464.1 Thymidine kinase [Strawberry lethal yellows phytoplasma (CPA) str. NZSb11]CAM12047.1 Thymidine kinase [Candidatus Phytoplasma australiense]
MPKEQQGFIEVICGPMFAGKTEALIKRYQEAQKLKKNILSFKPRIDNRYSSEGFIVSHSQNKFPAILIDQSRDILPFVTPETDLIIIDEVQFLDNDIFGIVDYLANQNIQIILAGLDLDFKGKPFGPMPYLLALAEVVTKLTAICAVSGKKATKTQRLINGKPAKSNDSTILVGGQEYHEPRCRRHHELLDVDKKTINL